jgi:hypothetical protein
VRVLGAIGIVALLGIVVVFGGLWSLSYFLRLNIGRQWAQPTSTTPTVPPPPTSAAIPFDGPMDGLALIQKSRAMAGKDARIFYADFLLTNGMVDASGIKRLTFLIKSKVPNAPPGADVKTEEVDVRVKNGQLTADRSEGNPALTTLDMPTCGSRDAWRSAVQSGVPTNAIVSMWLTSHFDKPVWSLSVEGHPEYLREVDARTCRIR